MGSDLARTVMRMSRYLRLSDVYGTVLSRSCQNKIDSSIVRLLMDDRICSMTELHFTTQTTTGPRPASRGLNYPIAS